MTEKVYFLTQMNLLIKTLKSTKELIGQPGPFNFAKVGNFVNGQLDASVKTTSSVK